MSERDELAMELFIGDNSNQPRESSIQDWTWFKVAGKHQGQVEHYKAMAAHVIAIGYTKRQTVTEWAAAFAGTGNAYNFHRTREEAQAFVDDMNKQGTDMVVMTRQVLPSDASDWKPVDETSKP